LPLELEDESGVELDDESGVELLLLLPLCGEYLPDELLPLLEPELGYSEPPVALALTPKCE